MEAESSYQNSPDVIEISEAEFDNSIPVSQNRTRSKRRADEPLQLDESEDIIEIECPEKSNKRDKRRRITNSMETLADIVEDTDQSDNEDY